MQIAPRKRGAGSDPTELTECFLEHADGFVLELKNLTKEKVEAFEEQCKNALEGKDLALMLNCGDAEELKEEVKDLSFNEKKKVMDFLVGIGAIEDPNQDNSGQENPK